MMARNESKNSFLKYITLDSVAGALLMCAIGLVFIILPKTSSDTLCTISGILFIVMGIVAIAGRVFFERHFSVFSLVIGALFIVCGIMCIANPALVQSVLMVFFGLLILFNALVFLINRLDYIRARIPGSVAIIVFSAVLSLCGLAVIFAPYEVVIFFVGWLILFDGLATLILTIVFNHNLKNMSNSYYDNSILNVRNLNQ